MELSEEELGQLGRELFVSSIDASASIDDPDLILKRCEANDEKYIDLDFPAQFSSLIKDPEHSARTKFWSKYVWRRATEFLNPSNLQVFSGGITPADIRQGALGNCYFLSALSCLCEEPSRIENLFLTKKANTAGVYGVRMCINGDWKVVVVDDYLPCGSHTTGPVFSKANGPELWVQILEKAMAKCYGSYERLEKGYPMDALRDLTGAPCILFKQPDENLWEVLLDATQHKFVVTASAGNTQASQQLLERMGLVGAQSYAIIHAFELDTRKGPVRLVKLRNPWGTNEWKGDWSDNSMLWTPELKKKANFNSSPDGTFFMDFYDFIDYFSFITVCKIFDNFKYNCVHSDHKQGKFKLIQMKVPEKATIYLTLTQPDERCYSLEDNYCYSDGRMIVAKENDDGTLDYQFGLMLPPRKREVCQGFEFEPGTYQISVQFDWKSKNNQFVVSAYGQCDVQFSKLNRRSGFLDSVYRSCALKTGKRTDYLAQGLPECVKYAEIRPEGFGYFYIVNRSETTALRENCFFKTFKGLSLLPPYSGAKYTVTVEPGEDCLILLRQSDPKGYSMSYTCNAVPISTSNKLIERAKNEGNCSKRKHPRTGQELEIYMYSLKHESGICYFYENLTTNKILEETIRFKLKGLKIVGTDGDTAVVSLEPGESKLIELITTSNKWSVQTSVSYSISAA